MQEVTIKKSTEVHVEDSVKTFMDPKFVFVLIEEGFTIKVQDTDYVYKNDTLAVDRYGHSVKSSVSGRVLGVKRMDYYDKSDIPSLVIENDFKENIRLRRSVNKYINRYNKKDFLRILKDTSYKYKNLYSYVKFKQPVEELLINGVQLDPYFENKRFILRDYAEEILDMSDYLANMLGSKKVKLVVKNTDSDLINDLMSLLGTYPSLELKLIGDAYPNGHAEVQKKLLKSENALVVDLEELLDIFKILKRERPVTTKLITVTGDAVKPQAVVKVKLGTLLSEVFVHNFDFTKKDIDVYINGMLYGKKADSLKFVIDSNIDGVYVTDKTDIVEEACMNCGQCSKTCPMGLNPKYVFDHEGKVTNEYYDKCLNCGLCNYVCPANRDLRSRMKGSDKP